MKQFEKKKSFEVKKKNKRVMGSKSSDNDTDAVRMR